jgi:hypothetical protein
MLDFCNFLRIISSWPKSLTIKYIQFDPKFFNRNDGKLNRLKGSVLLIKCQPYSSDIRLSFNCLSYLCSRK